MPFVDLREFLKFLEQKQELIHIERKVNPVHEIAAYIRKTSDRQGPALLFDQFEEAFTLGKWSGFKGKVQELFAQLADLVENCPPEHVQRLLSENPSAAQHYNFDPCGLRVVITLREDYLSDLEKWKRTLPSLMRNRMALEELPGDRALEAVTGPARLDGRNLVSDEVGRQIVRVIARCGEDTPIEEIEAVPPLLSLLCEQLNRARVIGVHPRDKDYIGRVRGRCQD